ncbi:MAG: hypothetical protein ACLRSW_07635 [Christensenellaceae bacterium]
MKGGNSASSLPFAAEKNIDFRHGFYLLFLRRRKTALTATPPKLRRRKRRRSAPDCVSIRCVFQQYDKSQPRIAHSPAAQEPKEIPPCKSFPITTLEAQFRISPTREAISG